MRLGLSLPLLFSAFLLPAAAHADNYNFTISGGGDNYTFSIDPGNTPSVPSGPGIIYSVTPDVMDTYTGGSSDIGSIVFFNPATGSQLIGISEIYFTLPVDVWNGTTFIPTAAGSPDTGYFFGDTSQPYDITIVDGPSIASTPEPSSLALLGTGVLGVFGIARRRYLS